jgi:hypothetical protein
MAYNMSEYEQDQKQQMHSILDNGLNQMRQSSDRNSMSNQSMSSSRHSPSLRKKSEIRRVLDEMKSNASSVGTYNDDTHNGYYNLAPLESQNRNDTFNSSNYNAPLESPMKRETNSKKLEMQNELEMLQK